jgi:uncharacterized protein (TIGR02391 family)
VASTEAISAELVEWARPHRPLLAQVWQRAWADGSWPDADELTRATLRRARTGDVRALASTMPSALGGLRDNRVVLTIRGASLAPGSRRVLVAYVRGVALAVSRLDGCPRSVSEQDFETLGLADPRDLRMLWNVVDAESWALRPVGDPWDGPEHEYAVTTQAALRLRGVRTLPAYLRAQAAAWWPDDGPRSVAVAFGPAAAGRAHASEATPAGRALASGTSPARASALQAVEDAFRPLAAAGHHQEALVRSIVSLMTEMRRLTGLTIDGDALVNAALAPERGLLRVGDDTTETGRSVQRGTHLIARGVVAAIRNPAAHELIDLNAESADEQHAIVRFVARALDVATTPEPP